MTFNSKEGLIRCKQNAIFENEVPFHYRLEQVPYYLVFDSIRVIDSFLII